MNRMKKADALELRAIAALRVAEQLTPAEVDVDNAISSLMALSVSMMSAITDAHLSRVLGKDAFDSLGEAVALMFQARGRLMNTHDSLNIARMQIGLEAVSFGPWQDCPPPGSQTNQKIEGNVVSIAA